jgi:cbb3-type cytochrome oxidase subunit 3
MELVRSLLTVAAFAAFLAIFWWAYAPSRSQAWQRKSILEDGDD